MTNAPIPRNTATSTRPVRALAASRDWTGGSLPTADGEPPFDFVLVSSSTQYAAALSQGHQPILVTRDFSLTDRRGKLRLRLGRLIEPWRWRRTLLNEGIAKLYVVRGSGSTMSRVSAFLARVPVAILS